MRHFNVTLIALVVAASTTAVAQAQTTHNHKVRHRAVQSSEFQSYMRGNAATRFHRRDIGGSPELDNQLQGNAANIPETLGVTTGRNLNRIFPGGTKEQNDWYEKYGPAGRSPTGTP
jgi:hypothetical protein